MGFLTKLFGKKNRNEDIPAEELPAEQAGEDPDGEGALTAEEEAPPRRRSRRSLQSIRRLPGKTSWTRN